MQVDFELQFDKASELFYDLAQNEKIFGILKKTFTVLLHLQKYHATLNCFCVKRLVFL